MATTITEKRKRDRSSSNPFLLFLFYAFMIGEPLSTLPQAYNIWMYKQTLGVSMLSWCGYLISSFIWLCYGFFKKDMVLIISCIIWVITEGFVVLGLLVYR